MHLIFSEASFRTSCIDMMTMTGKSVIRVHVQQGIILCVDKTGSELFYQLLFRPQGFLRMADDWTGSVRDVCSRLLCQSITIDEQFLCGYQLIIDWYWLIDWFSDHRFPSIWNAWINSIKYSKLNVRLPGVFYTDSRHEWLVFWSLIGFLIIDFHWSETPGLIRSSTVSLMYICLVCFTLIRGMNDWFSDHRFPLIWNAWINSIEYSKLNVRLPGVFYTDSRREWLKPLTGKGDREIFHFDQILSVTLVDSSYLCVVS